MNNTYTTTNKNDMITITYFNSGQFLPSTAIVVAEKQ